MWGPWTNRGKLWLDVGWDSAHSTWELIGWVTLLLDVWGTELNEFQVALRCPIWVTGTEQWHWPRQEARLTKHLASSHYILCLSHMQETEDQRLPHRCSVLALPRYPVKGLQTNALGFRLTALHSLERPLSTVKGRYHKEDWALPWMHIARVKTRRVWMSAFLWAALDQNWTPLTQWKGECAV